MVEVKKNKTKKNTEEKMRLKERRGYSGARHDRRRETEWEEAADGGEERRAPR